MAGFESRDGARRGMLTLEQVRVEVDEGIIDTVVLAFTDMQGRLQGKRLSAEFGSALKTVYSTRASIADLVRDADLVIGAVLLPGAAAPKLITREMLKTMRPGAVIVHRLAPPMMELSGSLISSGSYGRNASPQSNVALLIMSARIPDELKWMPDLPETNS